MFPNSSGRELRAAYSLKGGGIKSLKGHAWDLEREAELAENPSIQESPGKLPGSVLHTVQKCLLGTEPGTFLGGVGVDTVSWNRL